MLIRSVAPSEVLRRSVSLKYRTEVWLRSIGQKCCSELSIVVSVRGVDQQCRISSVALKCVCVCQNQKCGSKVSLRSVDQKCCSETSIRKVSLRCVDQKKCRSEVSLKVSLRSVNQKCCSEVSIRKSVAQKCCLEEKCGSEVLIRCRANVSLSTSLVREAQVREVQL